MTRRQPPHGEPGVSHRSQLPQYLALLYGFLIAYASLEPFSGWMPPLPGTPFFLFAPLPSRYLRSDVAINVAAYFPFGLLLALGGNPRPWRRRLALAVGVGAVSSFSMEFLQAYLPTRDSNLVDFLANTAGATLGAVAGVVLDRALGLRERAARWRYKLFLGGRSGDLGLALLGIWLLAQTNPGIALFAATFDPSQDLAPDLASTLLEAAQSAFNVVGVGLFLALLLRERHTLGGAVLVLIGLALMSKGVAANLLLRPAAWETWLRPGVSLGVAAGSLVLLFAIWLPRPVRTTLCAIALLSSLLAPRIAPDLWHARAPLAQFDWTYGQLLNFNGLTHAVLIVWPILASIYLLWLAGQPGWGESSPKQDKAATGRMTP